MKAKKSKKLGKKLISKKDLKRSINRKYSRKKNKKRRMSKRYKKNKRAKQKGGSGNGDKLIPNGATLTDGTLTVLNNILFQQWCIIQEDQLLKTLVGDLSTFFTSDFTICVQDVDEMGPAATKQYIYPQPRNQILSNKIKQDEHTKNTYITFWNSVNKLKFTENTITIDGFTEGQIGTTKCMRLPVYSFKTFKELDLSEVTTATIGNFAFMYSFELTTIKFPKYINIKNIKKDTFSKTAAKFFPCLFGTYEELGQYNTSNYFTPHENFKRFANTKVNAGNLQVLCDVVQGMVSTMRMELASLLTKENGVYLENIFNKTNKTKNIFYRKNYTFESGRMQSGIKYTFHFISTIDVNEGNEGENLALNVILDNGPNFAWINENFQGFFEKRTITATPNTIEFKGGALPIKGLNGDIVVVIPLNNNESFTTFGSYLLEDALKHTTSAPDPGDNPLALPTLIYGDRLIKKIYHPKCSITKTDENIILQPLDLWGRPAAALAEPNFFLYNGTPPFPVYGLTKVQDFIEDLIKPYNDTIQCPTFPKPKSLCRLKKFVTSLIRTSLNRDNIILDGSDFRLIKTGNQPNYQLSIIDVEGQPINEIEQKQNKIIQLWCDYLDDKDITKLPHINGRLLKVLFDTKFISPN